MQGFRGFSEAFLRISGESLYSPEIGGNPQKPSSEWLFLENRAIITK